MVAMRWLFGAGLGCTMLLVAATSSQAEPISVRYTEGVARGFPVLRAQSGEVLAHGDFVQVAYPDRVESRLVFRFRDGSLYDETVTFDQRAAFTLLAYRIIQRGPSFPESLEATIDRATGRYRVRYRGDGARPEEPMIRQFGLPVELYNLILC